MTTITMHNGNNLIVPTSGEIQLNNGLKVSEQREKKSLMWGKCINGTYTGSSVLYPVYAADNLSGNFGVDGISEYHIVKDEDIIMSTKKVED